jgi:hypothetical protein
MIKTHEGATQYEHTLDHHLEFFSKAGSLFTKKGTFYGQSETALALFQKCWIVEHKKAMQLLFWLRDCRGGAGNRSGFRECIKWLAENDSAWVRANLKLITETGRWDDLKACEGTICEHEAYTYWADAINNGHGLAAKWVNRKKDIRLRKKMKLSPKSFRQLLVKHTKVVENDMCNKQWDEIEYKHVPSKAMSLYNKAFTKHDENRFEKFKEKVEKGEETINASVLFPHDCVRTAKNGDRKTADLQFNALPDYLEGTDQRIMVLCDSSGSMGMFQSGSVKNIDISVGLSLYCSDRLGKNNPFYRKFIQFCSEGKLTSWRSKSFSEAVTDRRLFDGACGSTRIDKALDMLLSMGQLDKATARQMPNVLLIVSDMQFSSGTRTYDTQTPVKQCLSKWKQAGFEVPKVIYWNLDGNAGSPDTARTNNIGLVSGFSPAILKSIFSAKSFTPIDIMNEAIEKYDVNVPNG